MGRERRATLDHRIDALLRGRLHQLRRASGLPIVLCGSTSRGVDGQRLRISGLLGTLGHSLADLNTGAGEPRLAVNLRLDGELQLPSLVVREAERAADVLARLTPAPTPPSPWRRYNARFRRRYGLGADRSAPNCLHHLDQDRIWCAIVALACELTAWAQMLALTEHPANLGSAELGGDDPDATLPRRGLTAACSSRTPLRHCQPSDAVGGSGSPEPPGQGGGRMPRSPYHPVLRSPYRQSS